MRQRLGLTLCTALALAACGSEARKATGGKAGGEILPASVSDRMLPYDQVRSQAPLVPKAGSSDDGKTDKDDRKAADKPPSEAAPEPASADQAE